MIVNSMDRMFRISSSCITIDVDVYVDFVKCLFCPKQKLGKGLSFEDVCMLTMKAKKVNKDHITAPLRSSQMWLPPEMAIRRIGELINIFLDYISGVGNHSASLPDFSNNSCLQMNDDGIYHYDFGDCARMNIPNLMKTVCVEPSKRKHEDTPQKGGRRKFPLTSTPKNLDYLKRDLDSLDIN